MWTSNADVVECSSKLHVATQLQVHSTQHKRFVAKPESVVSVKAALTGTWNVS